MYVYIQWVCVCVCKLILVFVTYRFEVDAIGTQFEFPPLPLQFSGPRAVKQLVGEVRERLVIEVGRYGRPRYL